MEKLFNNQLADSQATAVEPISPAAFDFERYDQYRQALNERCADFWEKQEEGILVYRRMRVAACFSDGCLDYRESLALQLGALTKSMDFLADVPNFLEPWYGIGTLASAFGSDYIWITGNAPALKPRFSSLDELLAYEPVEIARTSIGRHTLEMIDYFMEQTKGRLPVSFTDMQSPLNMIGHLLPLDQFFVSLMVEPEKVSLLFDRIADLAIAFNEEQYKRIGSALALPGHGFASTTLWKGLGISDDNAIMIAPEQYTELAAPSVEKMSQPWGGPAFHSCGDWSNWIEAVLKLKGLKMVDGAFSPQTDPGATDRLEAYHQLAHTGVVLNARMVGDPETVWKQANRLWVPGMKLILVTYCQTPEEQAEAYHLVHQLSQ
jgi:hypothetical protein